LLDHFFWPHFLPSGHRVYLKRESNINGNMHMKTARKPLTKTLRFETFKRDSFTCQYCGNTPPSVILEVDHINPVSKGGDNSIDNLVCSCFDCNRGKGSRKLSSVPETIAEKTKKLAEQEDQIKAFEKILRAKKRKVDRSVRKIEDVYSGYFPERQFTNAFRTSLKKFLEMLLVDELEDYMNISCDRIPHESECIKYFCGMAWTTIRERSQ
jgi:5-methylcytosine-specific restriction endonuclease McrA